MTDLERTIADLELLISQVKQRINDPMNPPSERMHWRRWLADLGGQLEEAQRLQQQEEG